MSDDPQRNKEGTVQIRKLLSIVNSPPVQQVIDTGIVPRLIGFLNSDENTSLQVTRDSRSFNIRPRPLCVRVD